MRVLIVEDDKELASVIMECSVLFNGDCEYKIVLNVRDALTELEHFNPDIIVLDYLLNGDKGTDLIPHLHSHQKIIMVSAAPAAAKIAALHHIPFLSKPFSFSDLRSLFFQLSKT